MSDLTVYRKAFDTHHGFSALIHEGKKINPKQVEARSNAMLQAFLPWLQSAYGLHNELKQTDANPIQYPVIVCMQYAYSTTPLQRVPYFTLDTFDMKIRFQDKSVQLPVDVDGSGESEQSVYLDVIKQLDLFNPPKFPELTSVFIQGNSEDREAKIENLRV